MYGGGLQEEKNKNPTQSMHGKKSHF